MAKEDETNALKLKDIFDTPAILTGRTEIESTVGGKIEGQLKIKEQASAASSEAGYGQVWVKNNTPNELYFTDDAGTDFKISHTDNSTNWDTAYTHSQDNTQAHSDYLVNSGADIAVGPITITADNSTADQAYVPMVLYNTDDTPPTASGFPIGTIYIKYIA